MTLEELRDNIKRIDLEILDLIAKRTVIAENIGKEKIKNGLPIFMPDVSKNVIARYRETAAGYDLNPDNMEMIARILIKEALERENSLKE